MKIRFALFPALILALALSACADRSGCPADLAAFGETEAREGKPASLPNARCEIDADERKQYFAARGTGTAWYCAPKRRFEEARLGRSVDTDFCPLDQREQALAAQRTGEELRKAQELFAESSAKAKQLEAANQIVEASEAELQARTSMSDVEQLRALAIERGWLPNPAISGELPAPPPPASIALPTPPVAPDTKTPTEQ